ncbi:MAG: hypothetical protein EOP34_06245 [Rickettsiales bacterium]|nr:MAG: hypothetical protein EOP34_06245 [Rickettsiales bacterium]
MITLFIIYISYGLLQIYKQAASRQSVLSCRGRSSSLRLKNILGLAKHELRSRQPRTKSLGTVINKHEPLALKAAAFESSAAYITAFIALTPFFQEGCNKGFMEYYLNTGNAKYCGDWKRVIFKTPGVLKIGSTVNIMENKKIENTYAVEESRQKDLLRDYRSQLDKSPIINMT